MIPIQLTIEGLYSYQERQKIDFADLTSAGLFGIFGTVGSGKSSILEAITFALYGEIDRLNSKEKRAYNMMNLKSDRSYIEFEFHNHNNTIYKIVRTFKRNSKKFNDVKSADSVFYEFKNNHWEPLEHTNAEKIIGLSYANFKRTIIIPQGQFKEFLELGASERTSMMKEIFGLQRYDLQHKTGELITKNNTKLDTLQGKLSGYEEVSEDHIAALNQQLDDKTKVAAAIQNDYNLVEEKIQKLKILKEDHEKLKAKKSELEQAKVDKIKIDEEEKQLLHYEKIWGTFHQLLKEKTKEESQIKEKTEELNQLEKTLQLVENDLKSNQQTIELLQPFYNNLPTKRLEELDFETLIKIKIFEEEIKSLKIRTQNGEKAANEVTEETEIVKVSLTKLEKDWENLKLKKIDSQVLLEVGQWFSEQKNAQSKDQELKNKIADLQENIKNCNRFFEDQKIDEKTFTKDFESKLENYKTQIKALQEKKNHQILQQKLSHYADNLHDGDACPLCGALDHPNIATLDDVTEKITEIDAQITALEKEENILKNLSTEVENKTKEITFFENQLEKENELRDLNNQFLDTHKTHFIWSNFEAENQADYEAKKEQNAIIEKEIETNSEEIITARKKLEEAQAKLKKFELALGEFKLNELEKQTQIDQNKLNIRSLKVTDYEEISKETIDQQLQNLKTKNTETEQNYIVAKEKEASLNVNISAKNATIKQLSFDLEKTKSNAEKINSQIEESLLTHNISSLDIVVETLNWNLDSEKIREKIKEFTIHYQTLKNIIQDLELKFIDQTFDEDIFQNQLIEFDRIGLNLKEANKIVIELRAEIQRLTNSFEMKKELMVELGAIQKRADNLKTLSNLFKAAGFVQYVSSIYLRQLCDHANVRFHRMTRNQLSLQLNDQNDFEIIDYLNDGRSRSVKTLSGGQGFQVSLSLALALAESVQSNAKSEKNFFFIDEGFGTQDAESINIVFETLQSLLKENRIVGIISHVEELKERIPISLQITKDEERGSLIEIT